MFKFTKRHENATTDKLNVNPPFNRKEVNPSPRETQADEYEGWKGVKWLVHYHLSELVGQKLELLQGQLLP